MREALHDIELGYADIQALSDADAVAAFFERLATTRVSAGFRRRRTSESLPTRLSDRSRKLSFSPIRKGCSRFIFSRCCRY